MNRHHQGQENTKMRQINILVLFLGIVLLVSGMKPIAGLTSRQHVDTPVLMPLARLGEIRKAALSADGRRLAVVSSPGLWLLVADSLDSPGSPACCAA